MKRAALIFFMGIATIQAQIVFCPKGAEWHYLFNINNRDPSPTFENEKIKYVGDSIIGGDTVKILRHKKFFTKVNIQTTDPTLIKQRGDTVWFRNWRTQHTWQILYNFKTIPTDSWAVSLLNSNSNSLTTKFTFIVAAIGSTVINGFNLKTLNVSGGFGMVTLVERIGSYDFLFFYPNYFGPSDGDYFSKSLCYQDNEFGLLKYTSNDCNYTFTVDLPKNSGDVSPTIYPNPVGKDQRIKIAAPYEAKLFDCYGKAVSFDLIISETTTELDLTGLPAGLYILQQLKEGILVKNEKIIKE